jgi:hypothetical protein
MLVNSERRNSGQRFVAFELLQMDSAAVSKYTAAIKHTLASKDDQIQKLTAAGQMEKYLKNKWAEQCEQLKVALRHSEDERHRLSLFENQCVTLENHMKQLRSRFDSEQQHYTEQVDYFGLVIPFILIMLLSNVQTASVRLENDRRLRDEHNRFALEIERLNLLHQQEIQELTEKVLCFSLFGRMD